MRLNDSIRNITKPLFFEVIPVNNTDSSFYCKW